MMIGLTSSTEGWGKIHGFGQISISYVSIFPIRITIPLYLFRSNFKNTVNKEVEPDVR